ncbi:MAG TPA: DUF2934 domain-containing protein [Steroidobacteraceae bacterium]|nr:DUF2934 domain-containing protein [Steroidobacteraceae bacterium]
MARARRRILQMKPYFPHPPGFNPLRFSLPPRKITDEQRRNMIATAAYYRAERRHFEPGHELEDWLAAEADVDQELAGTQPR